MDEYPSVVVSDPTDFSGDPRFDSRSRGRQFCHVYRDYSPSVDDSGIILT
jgi:hypothetical protein